MKNIMKPIAVLAMVISGLAFAAPAASATDSDPVTFQLNLDVSDAASSQSSFNYKSTSIVRSAVNDKGQIVLTPVNKPTAHWTAKYAKKCPMVGAYPTKAQIKNFKPTNFILRGAALKQFRRAAMSDKVVKRLSHRRVKVSVVCFQLPAGKHFPDTGLALNGHVRGWDNVVKGSAMLFEIAKVTARRAGESTDAFVPIRRGQADSRGVYSIGDCGNKKPAVVEFTHEQVEYNDTDSYWWSDTGDVLARVHIGGSATISQGSCSMTLYYDFFAQGSAAYAVVVQGKTSIEAHGKVSNIVSKQSAHADASVSAAASVKANLKAQFTGCDTPPPPVDNPPSMECQGPQHIYVGDDAMYADFILTDPDGDPVSFSAPVVTGPLDIVLVEDEAVSGGKHRTVGIRAQSIPAHTDQNATLSVTGQANGKSVSCTVNITVHNP
jgi:hypothetical protein